MRVLLSAFACQPGLGSEPGVGWNLATHLAREHDVTVLTDVHNQAAIARAHDSERVPNPVFCFVEPHSRLGRYGGGIAQHYMYYVAWQLAARRRASGLHAELPFDLVHHATYVNSWMPSWMGGLGPAFIWSAGAQEITPPSFLAHMSWRGRAAETARAGAIQVFGRINRYITARRAQRILVSSPSTRWLASANTVYFPLGGLPQEEFRRLDAAPIGAEGPLRLISVGRLLAWKGLALGLAAFQIARRKLPASEYLIIGDGPERSYLQRLAHHLGLGEAVRFAGNLPRAEVFGHLQRADVLVHPSLHEQFGIAVLEAMAAGRPAVCLDSGPFPAVLGDRGGVRVRRGSAAEVVERLAGVLTELGENRKRLIEQGNSARAWAAEQWSWEAVTQRLNRLYSEIA
jgi:glycosyltransferase involved in cell wall biosynthesis